MRNKAVFFKSKDLATGIPEPSDEILSEMRAIVDRDLNNIRTDYKEQIYRLESFIKQEYKAIPRTEDFVNWFFDQKKIDQTGERLPKITDDEIFAYAQEYVEHLKKIIQRPAVSQYTSELITFRWMKGDMKLLYEKLIPDYIDSSTEFEAFERIFTGKPLSTVNLKIIWTKLAIKSRTVNKRAITDLISILTDQGFIDKRTANTSTELNHILSSCFASKKGDLKFYNSNSVDYNTNSECHSAFLNIIASLL